MCARVDQAKRIGQTRQNEEDVPQKMNQQKKRENGKIGK